jgi:siroheme synthase-like protein
MDAQPYFPICLDVSGHRCLVVGAGPVAAEKIDKLLAAGAEVHVVAPSACSAVEAMAMAGAVALERRPFSPSDVEGVRLVIVATDDALLNERVAAMSRAHGVLVNVADDPARCDFILPAVMNREPVQIAVSTGGNSPALARLLRQRLEALIGPEFGELAKLLCQVRYEARDANLRIPPAAWQDACDEYLLDLLRTDHRAAALHLLRTRLVAAALAAGNQGRRDLRDDEDEPASTGVLVAAR